MSALSLLVLAAALVLGGCRAPLPRRGAASEGEQVADTPAGRSSLAETLQGLPRESIVTLLDAYGRSFGDERATVIALLGAPTHIATELLAGIDTLLYLRYPTASFRVRQWTADHSQQLQDIRVWGPVPGLPPVVSPGLTTRSQLLAMLGNPEVDWPWAVGDTVAMVYQLPDPDFTFLLHFYSVGDTVRVMRWMFRAE